VAIGLKRLIIIIIIIIIIICACFECKAEVIPVIIRATGTISKSLRQYLSNISG
jgi:predicted PurR-regulated permease PerM